MKSKVEKTAKSTQEQAVASWINYLNEVRMTTLMETLSKEEDNLNRAVATIGETTKTIKDVIIENGGGRGGPRGMHGFIAECAEVGAGNAWEQIEGRAPTYEWINDNGPIDIRHGAEAIQQKFVNSGGHLSLEAIKQHLDDYPEFLKNGGKYQIPADHYEKIQNLLSISEEEANKMSTGTGDFSLRQWREVHEFFESSEISPDKIEPSRFKYKDVQREQYKDTLASEKQKLKARNKERRDEAHQNSKPSVQEGLKATAAAAAIEGATAFCMEVASKMRAGKKLSDFSADDWKAIAEKTGIGTLRGGVRGASIYMLTNHTATPAAVASALVTAAFGVAEQANKFRKGELDEVSFIENSEILCLDATVSALSSLAGQVLIPIPVLGAVIGNAVGTMLYQFGKESLSAKEQEILRGHLESIQRKDAELRTQYRNFIDALSENLLEFMGILERAFTVNPVSALRGSVELARRMGVPEDEILDSREKIEAYFLG